MQHHVTAGPKAAAAALKHFAEGLNAAIDSGAIASAEALLSHVAAADRIAFLLRDSEENCEALGCHIAHALADHDPDVWGIRYSKYASFPIRPLPGQPADKVLHLEAHTDTLDHTDGLTKDLYRALVRKAGRTEERCGFLDNGLSFDYSDEYLPMGFFLKVTVECK